MRDKDWLEKVRVAYNIYARECSTDNVEHFIQWLYKQYGIEFPNNA